MGLRLERSCKIVQSIMDNQRYWMRRAVEGCATHEELIELRKQFVYDHPMWKLLPRWAQTILNTIWDSFFEEVQSDLIFSYVCPHTGKRIAVSLDDDIFDYQAIGTAPRSVIQGDFCYAVLITTETIPAKLYYIPWNKTERENDIKAGRLPKNFQEIVANYNTNINHLVVRHKQNGKQKLMHLVEFDHKVHRK